MRPVARLVAAIPLAVLCLSCNPEQTSAPISADPLLHRDGPSNASETCLLAPDELLTRHRKADVKLACAFALPEGSKPIQNGTKSWVDGGRFYLTELANASVFIWDAGSHEFIGSVTGFVGSTGSAATSGPNSIVLSGEHTAWVSDGISAVQVVDLKTRSIVKTISTAIPACDNGTIHNCQRTNEITYDPEHHIIFVQNPSPLNLTGGAIDTYGTFISSRPPYKVLGTITFPDRRGQEAPLWDQRQHRIVNTVSGRLVGTTVFHQFIALIDPTVRPFAVEKEFDVDCTALGLTGTGGARLFGINDPTLAPHERMVLPGCGRALIMDARTGTITSVLAVGGGNETTYGRTDGNFYVTGANFSTTPAGPNSLGVIQARSSTILQYIPAVGATNPAASPGNNQVFAVVPANANPTACTAFGLQSSGCIAAFAHVRTGPEKLGHGHDDGDDDGDKDDN